MWKEAIFKHSKALLLCFLVPYCLRVNEIKQHTVLTFLFVFLIVVVGTNHRNDPESLILYLFVMELKVWVDGVQRVVCGVSDQTTCQEVVIALARAIGK